ncbi:MAG: hypothetical protein ACTSQP_02330 [Promethearchaeota archaeon]
MSYKDLYSEVRRRKLEALNKKDVVKAVEKHGKMLFIDGKFEKAKKIVDSIYASKRDLIKTRELNKVLTVDLNQYDVVLIGCPGNEIPTAAHPKIKEYVLRGGWLITTDWAIRSIIEVIFPGYIRWNEQRTGDTVVACQILEPNHPFLHGVLSEITQEKWQKHTYKTKKEEFRWWLENRSFPIQIINPAVRVLIASQELQMKWGDGPVLVEFNYGNNGGKIIHMISHAVLQKGGKKGQYASALILTNILDEAVSRRMGLSKGTSTPQYVSDWESAQQPQQAGYQIPLEEQWVHPPQQAQPQENYLTPSLGTGPGLTGTAQIQEVDPNAGNFSYGSKCAYCEYDFGEFTGKIYKCSACGALYHDSCLNIQINEGVCKKCGSILLW